MASRTRLSSALLLIWAATWSVVALIAATTYVQDLTASKLISQRGRPPCRPRRTACRDPAPLIAWSV